MIFNSYIFILLFLPITLLAYYGCNYGKKETAAKWVLIMASLIFYGFFDVRYLIVLTISICFNFVLSKLLQNYKVNKYKKTILVLGILGNTGALFWIKYWNFFLENMNRLWGTSWNTMKLLLPLGISFFTFQQIAYLVDSYGGETKEYGVTDYVLFVTYFPKVSMGPIVLHDQFMPQLREASNKLFHSGRFALGIWWFSMGMAKKVLLADTLAKGVDWAYANVELLKGADVLAVSVLYTLQLYFDFSGYCDMAAGVGELFQISLPRNFNSPYKANSITDFWNRWHMTLSGFLQKYIYFPLGGSRGGLRKSIRNILIVFAVSGIWHGAAWTFVVWGLLHGVARVFHKIFEKPWSRLPKIISWFLTFCFLNFTWIFFRAENLTQAGILIRKLFTPFEWKLETGLLQQFDVLEFTYIEEHVPFLLNIVKTYPQVHLLLIGAIALGIALIPKNLYEKDFSPSIGKALACVVLLVWSILSFSGVSTFLYFNF